MLIVSSLEGVQTAYANHHPVRVISLLSKDEALPRFDQLPEANHLKLYMEQDACSATISKAAKKRAEEIIEFVKAWDGAGDILIHCNRGVSRSMAAAYVTMCMKRKEEDEAAIARELRDAAPHADPCPLIIAYADDIMERDGRMLDAIEDLSPPCADIAPPMLTLPLAA